MRTVRLPLSRGKVALIDKDDFERVSRFKWSAVWNQGSLYVLRNIYEDGTKRHVYLHRLIVGDVPKGMRVIHINRNRLDNRKSNLRIERNSPPQQTSPRPLIANGDGTFSVKLTKGLTAIIDEQDAERIGEHVWHASRSGSAFYARASLRGPLGGIQLHRFLLNPLPGLQVDHINGDTMDNRRCNIRVVTGSENMQAWADRHFGSHGK